MLSPRMSLGSRPIREADARKSSFEEQLNAQLAEPRRQRSRAESDLEAKQGQARSREGITGESIERHQVSGLARCPSEGSWQQGWTEVYRYTAKPLSRLYGDSPSEGASSGNMLLSRPHTR